MKVNFEFNFEELDNNELRITMNYGLTVEEQILMGWQCGIVLS